MSEGVPCGPCATSGVAGFCEHRSPAPPPVTDRPVFFCPSCFADEEGGSWNCEATASMCLNCGNMSTVLLPKWAVTEIRRSAAWVGARYYPDDETKARQRELRRLRREIGRWPGRTVEEVEDDPTVWRLRQEGSKDAGFAWSETLIKRVPGEPAEVAIARTADCLPWVPEPEANSTKGSPS